MSLKDTLLQRTGGGSFTPAPLPAGVKFQSGVAVTQEWLRIKALPRRLPGRNAVDLTAVFLKPGSDKSLWPIQSESLLEMEAANGLLAPIGVGHGKFLITALAPVALESKQTVLMVPANLLEQTELLLVEWAKHFTIPTWLIHVVSYHMLSSAKQADILERLQPDLVVCDEAHNLRHRSAARTKRFLRYARQNPACRFVFLSGTLTTKSLKDYAHLSELALRKNSPLPRGYHELQEWSEAIDVSDSPRPPGVLKELMNGPEMAGIGGQKGIRSAFRRRLVETPGVCATDEASIGTSLVLSKMALTLPKSVKDALKQLEKLWATPDGNEFEDALTFHRVARQLSLGFWLRWDWPGGIVDDEWVEARSAWHREMAAYLNHSSRPGMDSPLLLAQAARSGKWKPTTYAAWAKVAMRPAPATIAEWVDDFVVKACVRWAQDRVVAGERGIIWYEHRALGDALEKFLPLFGGGDDRALLSCSTVPEDFHPVIVCSRKAHGDGKNLQQWHCNLFPSPMANGKDWEQTLGRTHRPGQEEDEVGADLMLHTRYMKDALEEARKDAHYIEDTTGMRQKLNYATYNGI
jgi:hypothetical protein